MDTVDAKKYWIALNMVPGVGPVTYRKLLNAFGSPEQVFQTPFNYLITLPGINEKTAHNICSFGFPDIVKQQLDAIDKYQVQLVLWEEDAYPDKLKTIFDPPPVLYVRGKSLQSHDPMVAVVGSRRSSTYGRTVAENLCRDLALKGITVISGMARGIDSAAHWGALKARGRTLAVMGCGVDVVYPPENEKLYREILEHGAIISEFPLFTKPDRGNFPARNRIISGMSLGTVVVEAGSQSGALITADMALEQGRDVFAVPGNITSASSQGTNRLIKQGAALIENVDDILHALQLELVNEIEGLQRELPLRELPILASLTADEQKIIGLIGSQPIHIDEITIRSQLASGTVSALLIMLEMKNIIRQIAGKMFVRT